MFKNVGQNFLVLDWSAFHRQQTFILLKSGNNRIGPFNVKLRFLNALHRPT